EVGTINNNISFIIPIASSPNVSMVVLTEPDTPPGSAAVASDAIFLEASGSNATNFTFISDNEGGTVLCPVNATCIPETGSDQELTDAFFPAFLGPAPFRIIVSSDVTPEVPEPTTIALIGVGLSGLGLAGRKRLGSVRSLLASLGAVLVLLASPSVTHAATIS